MKADCHVHFVLDGADYRASIARHRAGVDEALIRRDLERYRDAGCTFLRSGGDKWGTGLRAAKVAGEYGIDLRTPVFPICKAGHYGAFIGRTYETMGDYRKLLEEVRAAGGSFVKIMISGLMDFDRFGVLTEPGMDPAEIAELIRIAHDMGFAVMAHANGARTVEAACRAGVDSVEHGAYLNADAVAALAQSGAVWVPTLATIASLRGKGRFDDAAVAQILESARENVARCDALGGLIAPGSDAGAWQVYHGDGMGSEYRELKTVLGIRADSVLDRGVRKIQEKF